MKKGRRERPSCLPISGTQTRQETSAPARDCCTYSVQTLAGTHVQSSWQPMGYCRRTLGFYRSRLCYIFWAWNLGDASHTIILIKANANGLSYTKGENLG